MAEKTTIARPYAKAVFAIARGQGKLDVWLTALPFRYDTVRFSPVNLPLV